MSNVRTVEGQGFSKEKAFSTTGLDVELGMLKNATQSWKKAGSPINTKKLNEFLATYIKERKALGAYIVVEAASDDTRSRPYTVANEVTKGKRKATTVYQIKAADVKLTTIDVVDEEGEVVLDEEGNAKKVTLGQALSTGAIEGRAYRKDEALKIMKELIEVNKKDYTIEICKEITEGQRYAAHGKYTPSKSAKIGKFVFGISE